MFGEVERKAGEGLRSLAVSWLACGLMATLFSSSAAGEERSRILESGRFLGRGNTYVAGFDSDEATRANPAILAETKVVFQLRWLQTDLFLGKNSVDSISDIATFSSEDSAVAMLDMFKDKFGKRQYARLQLSPLALRIRWLEVSPFFSTNNFIDVRLPSTPEVTLKSESAAGVNFALGLPLGKTLTMGLNIRPMHRTIIAGDTGFADLMAFIDDKDFEIADIFPKQAGLQIGVDSGFIWQPGKDWRFGLHLENIGYAGNYGEAQDAPPPMAQRLNLGIAYRYNAKPWNFDFLFDIQDIINPQQYHYLRLLHFGTELGRSFFSRDNDVGLQLGLNEGYLTGGAFLNFFVARLQLSYYAAELGEYPGQRPDRRWGASLISSMTF